MIGKNLGQFHSDFNLSEDYVIKYVNKKYNTIYHEKLYIPDNLLKDLPDIVGAQRFIALGKKCYIDELLLTNNEVDYHIRMKGIPNNSILKYCETNNITPFELYE